MVYGKNNRKELYMILKCGKSYIFRNFYNTFLDAFKYIYSLK
jgi:hypothetical protein